MENSGEPDEMGDTPLAAAPLFVGGCPSFEGGSKFLILAVGVPLPDEAYFVFFPIDVGFEGDLPRFPLPLTPSANISILPQGRYADFS